MSIKKLGTDLWQLRLTYKDKHGQKQDLRRRFSGSYGDARALEAELSLLRAKGDLEQRVTEATRADDGVSTAMTVSELATLWLRDYAEHEMNPSSYQSCEGHFRIHVLPALGRRPVSGLRPKELSDFLRGIAQSRSPATANKVRATLASMFTSAVRWEILEKNPITRESVPPARQRRKGRFENFLTPEEARAFVTAIARSDEYRRRFPLYLYLLETGVRFGELAALRIADLDLKNRRAHIHKAVRQNVETSTKGDDERTVALSATLVEALRDHVMDLMATKVKNPKGLVFPSDSGSWLTPESLRCSMPAGLKAAGIIRHVTIHGLRHSFCTMLALDGRSALEIAHRAGHAQSSTSERYIHLAEALEVAPISIVEKVGVGLYEIFKGKGRSDG